MSGFKFRQCGGTPPWYGSHHGRQVPHTSSCWQQLHEQTSQSTLHEGSGDHARDIIQHTPCIIHHISHTIQHTRDLVHQTSWSCLATSCSIHETEDASWRRHHALNQVQSLSSTGRSGFFMVSRYKPYYRGRSMKSAGMIMVARVHCPWHVPVCFTRPHGVLLLLYSGTTQFFGGPALCETGTYTYNICVCIYKLCIHPTLMEDLRLQVGL